MEVYTEAEKSALSQFRQRIGDLLSDEFSRSDENLIRWLRARDLDLEKAEQLMRKSMQWREENKIHSILDDGLDEEMHKLFPFHMDGLDIEGRLVVCVPMGEWDVRDSVDKHGPEPFTRYTTQVLEKVSRKMRELHEASGNKGRALRYVVICDYEGFSMKQLVNMKSVNTLLSIVSTYEAHYPETLQTCFTINAPTIFSILFGLMKPLMTARTLNKMRIFSANRKEWEKEVLKDVDPSQIRPRYGGTKEN